MSFLDRRSPSRAIAVLTGALVIGGCQGLPGPRSSSVDTDGAMPGEISRARYSHVLEAIETLDEALSDEGNGLDAMPLDTALRGTPSSAVPAAGGASADTAGRALGSDLIDAGPYHLVRADTLGGRLEYRSESTGAHLAVTVRAPDRRERDEGRAFVVTDVFGWSSLAERVRASRYGDAAGQPGDMPFARTSARSPAGRAGVGDDAAVLAHLGSLPAIEREREDLLGLQAMLSMRLGEDARARALVQQGIVRYPEAPLFFTLAGLLLERAGDAGAGASTSLATIMEHRFDKREIRSSRRTVERFMRGDSDI